MNNKIISYFFLIFIVVSFPSYAWKICHISNDFVIEVFEPQDEVPYSNLSEGLKMYYEAYLFPKLHEGIPLSELNIDETKFSSYEEFIMDMFITDFNSYHEPGNRFYIQARNIEDGQIVGICALLVQDNPGYYYKDHIGTHKDFRRMGIGSQLLQAIQHIDPEFVEISLDTRVFNYIAQAFYEKNGFEKLEEHPNPKKQHTYFHYVFKGISN